MELVTLDKINDSLAYYELFLRRFDAHNPLTIEIPLSELHNESLIFIHTSNSSNYGIRIYHKKNGNKYPTSGLLVNSGVYQLTCYDKNIPDLDSIYIGDQAIDNLDNESLIFEINSWDLIKIYRVKEMDWNQK